MADRNVCPAEFSTPTIPRSSRQRRRRTWGFTLPELLTVIGLLTVFGLVSARLFTASMRLVGSSRAAETSIVRFENALTRLRADVWAARDLRVADPGTLVAVAPEGETVTWTASDGGVLTRTTTGVEGKGARAEAWAGIGKVAFAVEGPVVTVTVPDGNSGAGVAAFTLVSQVKLAATGGGM